MLPGRPMRRESHFGYTFTTQMEYITTCFKRQWQCCLISSLLGFMIIVTDDDGIVADWFYLLRAATHYVQKLSAGSYMLTLSVGRHFDRAIRRHLCLMPPLCTLTPPSRAEAEYAMAAFIFDHLGLPRVTSGRALAKYRQAPQFSH